MTTIRRTALLTASAAVVTAGALVAGLTTLGGTQAAGAQPHRAATVTTAADTGAQTHSTMKLSAAATGTGDVLQLDAYRSAIGAVVTPYSSMEAFLTASLLDVDATWKRYFKQWGYKAPSVNYAWPRTGQSVRSGCGGTVNASTFVYCSGPDQIVINQDAAVNLWNGVYGQYKVNGTADMSVAIFVAHEYGHNIAAELGLRTTAAQGERVADCFAGFWAWDAAQRGRIDRSDWTEAYQGLALLADHPEYTTHIHGTAAQRQQAFYLGATQGAAACVKAYTS